MVFEFADSWTHIVALRIWLRSALQPDNVLDALRRFADRRANGSIFSVVLAVVLAAVVVVIWNRQAKPAVPLGASRARRGVQQATMKGPVDQAAPPKPAEEPKPVQQRSSDEPATAMDSKPDGPFNPFTNLDDDSPNNTLKVDNAKDSASSHHDRNLSRLLSDTITNIQKSVERHSTPEEAAAQQTVINQLTEKYEKMEFIVEQSVKEFEFLNEKISLLQQDLAPMDRLRLENRKLKRECMALQKEIADLKQRQAGSVALGGAEEKIRNLEYQLLYGDTEKDKLIASLRAELSKRDEQMKTRLERNQSVQDDSINKWLFEETDTEFSL